MEAVEIAFDDSLFMEDYVGSPERSLWSSVILLLIKDVDSVRRRIEKSSKMLKTRMPDFKRVIWDSRNKRAIYDRRDIMLYVISKDFELVCDQAGINLVAVREMIYDVMYGKTDIKELDFKRGFTRVKDRGICGKKDD